jgi:hypothetical protein
MAAANEDPAKATGPKAFHSKSRNFWASVGGTYGAAVERLNAGADDEDTPDAERLDDSPGVTPSSTEEDWARTAPPTDRTAASKSRTLKTREIISTPRII